jgi:DNA polymerase III delta prime subunit
LTADAKESLLETIASRCEVVRLRPTSIETLEYYLQEEKRSLQPEQNGLPTSPARVGTALSFDQNQDLLDAYDDALTDLADLLNARLRQRLQYVERCNKEKWRHGNNSLF